MKVEIGISKVQNSFHDETGRRSPGATRQGGRKSLREPEQDAMIDVAPQKKLMPQGPVYVQQNRSTNVRITEAMHRNSL
jgi:hypothetical protein